MRTQCKEVHDYMKTEGAITSLDAIQRFGITRLSAVIYDLINKHDVQIFRQTIQVPTRRGHTHVTEYAVRKKDLRDEKGSES